MSHQTRDQILTAYDWTQTQLQKIFDAIPREQYLHQPFPGANHALWTMGHLATVDQFFLKSVAGRDAGLFERYSTLFFAKSTPSPSADTYPPIDTVREYFDSSRKAFRTWIESLDDERLAAPLPAEQQRFAPSVAGMLMRLLWHEGMHYGQLTVLRKSLGLAPVRI
jgi:uncharacterized damage-inducible protein DinB